MEAINHCLPTHDEVRSAIEDVHVPVDGEQVSLWAERIRLPAGLCLIGRIACSLAYRFASGGLSWVALTTYIAPQSHLARPGPPNFSQLSYLQR